MMKTIQSIDGSIGHQSYISPIKNNKSSTNFQTMASLQLSDFSQNNTILPINSAIKPNNQLQSSPTLELFKIQQSQDNIQIQSSQLSTDKKLVQLTLIQRWVYQTYYVYNQNQIQIKQNQQKINKIQHRNRLKIDQAQHSKKMGEYLQNKYNKYRKQRDRKQRQYVIQINQIIAQTKQRTEQLMEEIRQLESDIDQQFNKQKVLIQQRNYRRNRRNKQAYNTSDKQRYDPYSQTFQPNHPQQMSPAYNYGYPYPYPYPPPYWGQPQNVYAAPQRHPDLDSNSSKTASILPYIKKQSNGQSTPHFLSKKTSVNQVGSPTSDANPLLQALAAHLLGQSNKLHGSQKGSIPIRVSGNGEQIPHVTSQKQLKSVKKKGSNLKQIKISQYQQNEDNALYSPTNVLQTPNFDGSFKFQGFSDLHQNLSKQTQRKSHSRKQSKNNSSRKSQKNMAQSKILVDVDQSFLTASKFSVSRKRKPTQNNIRQSTIKIQTGEDQSRSGEASMIEDGTPQQIHQNPLKSLSRLRSPTMDANNQQSSQFQKININENFSSQKLNRPMPAPPKLTTIGKKLRKVTQQQSDLFDSEGQPRTVKKQSQIKIRQVEPPVQVKDVVLDKSNLRISEAVSYNNLSLQNNQKYQQQIQNSRKIEKKKTTEQDQDDDDDFLNVNLLAVSKISKQKQYSQKQYKTISEEGDESPRRIPSAIHKSHNMTRKSQRPTLESVQQQQNFIDEKIIQNEASKKRIRKSSGSRFSLVQQSPSLKADLQRLNQHS